MESLHCEATRETVPDLNPSETFACSLDSEFARGVQRDFFLDASDSSEDEERTISSDRTRTNRFRRDDFPSVGFLDDADDDWAMCNRRMLLDPGVLPGVQEHHGLLNVSNFSEIHRCSFKKEDGEMLQVAVKVFDQHVRLQETASHLVSELQHPNLLGLHAAVNGLTCYHVLELCVGGNLKHILHTPANYEIIQSYDTKMRLRGARDIVCALEYLQRVDLVHLDVQPQNCLLAQIATQGFLPLLKLGGFDAICHVSRGFAVMADEDFDPSCARWRGAVEYRAPEVINYDTFDGSAAIFSCGIFLHEFLSCQVPYGNRNLYQVVQSIREGERPPLDVFSDFHARASIRRILGLCWDVPARRITASAMITEIDYLICVA